MKDSLKNGSTSIIRIKQNCQLNSAQPLCSCSGRELGKEQKKCMLILLFQKRLQKNLCEGFIRFVGVIHRLYDNAGCCLSSPKSCRDWRSKMGKWHGWSWSCERSNRDHQSSSPMLCGFSYVYSVLCWSWTVKHCIENLEEKIGSNGTLNHNLSRLNDTVIPRRTCILYFLAHRSRRN